jgi:malate dehydrogenase (quinone)
MIAFGPMSMTETAATPINHPDVVLIGAGIMSATLAVILKELQPDLKITIFERLESAAQESSNAWNNAGTGHAALCELNYTPERSDGSIDIAKALDVNAEFDLSRQFWAYLVKKGSIKDPQSFIHSVSHCSFVRGADNVAFLKRRFQALTTHHAYKGMEYSDDKKQIKAWFPLVMEGRNPGDRLPAVFNTTPRLPCTAKARNDAIPTRSVYQSTIPTWPVGEKFVQKGRKK